MSGQLDFGTTLNNAGAARIGEAKAFSEGIYYRAGGTLAGRPLTDNPHPVGSPDHDAWDRGWAVADDVAPAGTISQSSAPGVAIPTNVVVDV
jgi:hypothetical protein